LQAEFIQQSGPSVDFCGAVQLTHCPIDGTTGSEDLETKAPEFHKRGVNVVQVRRGQAPNGSNIAIQLAQESREMASQKVSHQGHNAGGTNGQEPFNFC
jgi:hypothetical protein